MSGDMNGIHLEDAALEAIGIDPWQDRGWGGDDLEAFVVATKRRFGALREAAEAAVLAEKRCRELQPWMAPLVERALAQDLAYVTLVRVHAVAEQAARARDTLLFQMD